MNSKIPPYKLTAYNQARSLRREGVSVRQIAKQLGVSKASVSVWVRDVPLTEAQREKLRASNPVGKVTIEARAVWMLAATKAAENRRLRRERHRAAGYRMAQELDPLYIKGCMLYWAEGKKSRNVVRFTNTAPDMVRLFLRFLNAYWPDAVVRIIATHHGKHATDEAVARYWSNLLQVQESAIKVERYRPRTTSGKRTKIHTFGACELRVNSTDVAQQIAGGIDYLGQS